MSATKVKCIAVECGDDCLTVGKVYEIDFIDADGDIWIKEDDQGDAYLLYPREAEIIE